MWKTRTNLEKIFIIIIAVITIYTTVVTVQKIIYKTRYYQSLEKEYLIARDSINTLNYRIKDLTLKQQIWTKDVQKKSNEINDKLKDDEETIDNRDVSDRELDEFLARYEDSKSFGFKEY